MAPHYRATFKEGDAKTIQALLDGTRIEIPGELVSFKTNDGTTLATSVRDQSLDVREFETKSELVVRQALEGTPGNVTYGADLDTPVNKGFVTAWKAKFNRLPTDNEGIAYNGAQVMFEGVRKAGSVKPADVAKALRGAQIETIYGKVVMRPEDNQLVLPNIVGRAKDVDGSVRPVIEKMFPVALTPPPSPLCKL